MWYEDDKHDKKDYDDYDKKHHYDYDKKHYDVKYFDLEVYFDHDHDYPCKPKKKYPKQKKKLICKFVKDDHYDTD
ncbi:hypothetical protein CVD25_08425 [Bacillus canaveralius]|uniref:Uncharacterized protein n=1 Tax=Bacillus canaveralius TaxID=1403243 RepID=A0A2N5GIJ3_9BACI|nr:hypothetical protein [Bacillus canaveralius]PLR80740.1 hypothetical protein CU635_16945 [Bacillus canaveralius]PLR98382.1 hypothetical protein CVD25_08425 [Bacillus canaveralius]RSK53886.1 hypothetical protein EJA13_07190 [Bacillus canaveralius]